MTDTRNPFENHIDELKYTTINSLFDQKEKYLIIALTGKLGAGCSTLAGIFRKTLEEMNLSHGQPGIEGFQNDKEREVRLLQRYYSWHQKQFHVIKVRDVITSFLLEEHVWEALEQNDFYKIREIKEARLEIENRIRREHPEHTWENSLSKYVKYICGSQVDKNLREQCYEFITIYLPAMGEQIHTILKDQYTEIFQKFGNQLRFFGQIMVDAASIDKLIAEKYQYAGVRIACINGAGVQGEDYFELEKNIETIYTIAKRINRFIKYLRHPKNTDSKWPVAIVIDSMKNIYESNYLKERYTAFYLISSSRDEQLRIDRLHVKKKNYTQEQLEFLDLNERPSYARKKLRKFAGMFINEYFRVGAEPSCTDQKKLYLKNYLEDIASGNEQKLLERALKGNEECFSIDSEEFEEMMSEYSNQPVLDIFRENGISKVLFNYYCSILRDPLRIFLYISGLYSFFLQDVETCIQNADIFLTNNEQTEEKRGLCQSVVRYLSLMMHPGLVPPTPIERCMQIAYTAKLNSGCISRQVGAVVTDSKYEILSLGWNDVPCGQTPCIYRNLIDMSRGLDPMAYSEYEIGKGSEFKEFSRNYYFDQYKVKLRLGGLPVCFCFKDMNELLRGEKNPMESRAMHGEEKALLICDQNRAIGGYLFTTSSPCVMCAKNAKQHQIKKIYYIEPYPGISQSHVCNSGEMENRAKYELFEGAIGRAYTQLYTPVMPYKDELKLRGVPDYFKKETIAEGDKQDAPNKKEENSHPQKSSTGREKSHYF